MSCIEFHTFGFRDEIGEPCRCFLIQLLEIKKRENEKKKKGERSQRSRFCDEEM